MKPSPEDLDEAIAEMEARLFDLHRKEISDELPITVGDFKGYLERYIAIAKSTRDDLLAADLQAEKEKEVADLRAELDSYKKRVETLAMRIVDRDFKMANETLPAVDVVDLLDEVKRVLGAVAGCKLFYEDSADIDNYTTDDVNNLLTRLGPYE